MYVVDLTVVLAVAIATWLVATRFNTVIVPSAVWLLSRTPLGQLLHNLLLARWRAKNALPHRQLTLYG